MTDSNDPARERVQYVLNGRPAFFDDPAVDKLLAMNMALLGEICVLRDRLDTHERLASRHGLYGPQEVDEFTADEQASENRRQQRQACLDRVLKVLSEEVSRGAQR